MGQITKIGQASLVLLLFGCGGWPGDDEKVAEFNDCTVVLTSPTDIQELTLPNCSTNVEVEDNEIEVGDSGDAQSALEIADFESPILDL